MAASIKSDTECLEKFKLAQKRLRVVSDTQCRMAMVRSVLKHYQDYLERSKSSDAEGTKKQKIDAALSTAIQEMAAKKNNFLPVASWNALQNEFLHRPVDNLFTTKKLIKDDFIRHMPAAVMEDDADLAGDMKDVVPQTPAQENYQPVKIGEHAQMYATGYYEMVIDLARSACSDIWFRTLA